MTLFVALAHIWFVRLSLFYVLYMRAMSCLCIIYFQSVAALSVRRYEEKK
jgi:hypothetical protein